MLSVKQVADYLVFLAHGKGDPITHLKLQKLCYYVQGFSLAIRDRPMFEDEVQAWKHGPVVPALFHEHKRRENAVIPSPKGFVAASIPAEDRRLIQEVYNVYGQFSAWRLRELTHQEPPWKDVFKEGVDSIPIPLASMKAYFKTQIRQ